MFISSALNNAIGYFSAPFPLVLDTVKLSFLFGHVTLTAFPILLSSSKN